MEGREREAKGKVEGLRERKGRGGKGGREGGREREGGTVKILKPMAHKVGKLSPPLQVYT